MTILYVLSTPTTSFGDMMSLHLRDGNLNDLFMLGLWWQSGDSREHHRWSTVRSVCRVYEELGLITEAGSRLVAGDKQIQSRFARDVAIPSTIETLVDAVLKSESRMIVRPSTAAALDRVKLLSHMRIWLTDEGCMYAERIEPKYLPHVTREAYLNMRRILRERFEVLSEVAKASIRKRYRAEVESGDWEEEVLRLGR